jgi:predicted nucleic acid-binding Zn ribbon protein
MPTYLYKCDACGSPESHTALLADGNLCPLDSCGGTLKRDWRAESVGFKIVPGAHRDSVRRGRG